MGATPLIHLFLGVPGSGKSYFARNLAEKQGYVRLNNDAMRLGIFGSLENISAVYHSPNRQNVNTYVDGAVEYAASQLLERGQSVICDAHHNKRTDRERFEKLAQKYDAKVLLVWVKTPFETALSRGQQREASNDQRQLSEADMREVMERHEATMDLPVSGENVITIDGTEPFEVQHESYMAQLNALLGSKNSNVHLVDILLPPDYHPSGETQDIVAAIRAGAWLHVTNLWFYRTKPSLQLLFQQRDLDSPVFPGLLDCSVAGYLEAGEDGVVGGIREAKEELGVDLRAKQLVSYGRHLNAGLDHRGRERKWVINEYIVHYEDGSMLHPDSKEVPALFWIDIDALLGIEKGGGLEITGQDAFGNTITKRVTKVDFVPNVDDYHFRMAARIKANQ